MELELGIVREPYASGATQRVRVFGEAGGSIGRAHDNYWVLPDPKCHLSGRHCDIVFQDGAFWVRDTSRNGVFLGGSEQPLGFGRRARLRDGDELVFANYRVRVRLRGLAACPRPELGPEMHLEPYEQVAAEAVHPALADSVGKHAQSFDSARDRVNSLGSTWEYNVGRQHAGAPGPEAAPEREPVRRVTSETQKAAEVELAAHSDQGTDSKVDAAVDDAAEHVTSVWTAEDKSETLVATRMLDAEQVASQVRRIIHIDFERLRTDGKLPPESAERLISNQIRHIKRPLIMNALGKGVEPLPNGHLVMVTSSLPGEGKTFNSINLAFSIARERDLEVVLIDADLAKRDVSHIFGVTDEPGLLDALSDDLLDVESLILPTDLKGFSILPAGRCSESDVEAELLSSSRMDEIARQIGGRSRHRIALFDSPPLLLTNESRVLASLMGQIVLVVRAGVTPRQAVLEAVGYIGEQMVLGLLLNQSRCNAMGSYYGYGSYGYGAYGADREGKGTFQKGG